MMEIKRDVEESFYKNTIDFIIIHLIIANK